MTATAIANVLGGQKALKRRVGSDHELTEVTLGGLPSDIVASLAAKLQIDRDEIAKAVGIPKRTLLRRISAKQSLTVDESDRTVRLARVLAEAEDAIGDMNRASQWMQMPNLALRGKKPLELVGTDSGVRQVETVLGRIKYGLFS